jgi:hypothetical protein
MQTQTLTHSKPSARATHTAIITLQALMCWLPHADYCCVHDDVNHYQIK